MIKELTYKDEHVLKELKKILDRAKVRIKPRMNWARSSIEVMQAVSKAWRDSPDRTPLIIDAHVTCTRTVEVVHVCNPGTGLAQATFPLEALRMPPKLR